MKLVSIFVCLICSVFILNMGTVVADEEVRFEPGSTDINNIGGCDGAAANSSVCQDISADGNPLFGNDGILTRAAAIFGIVTGVISVFMMLIGGLRYINSAGDPQKTATARKTILYAGIGVIVASMAGALVRVMISWAS